MDGASKRDKQGVEVELKFVSPPDWASRLRRAYRLLLEAAAGSTLSDESESTNRTSKKE